MMAKIEGKKRIEGINDIDITGKMSGAIKDKGQITRVKDTSIGTITEDAVRTLIPQDQDHHRQIGGGAINEVEETEIDLQSELGIHPVAADDHSHLEEIGLELLLHIAIDDHPLEAVQDRQSPITIPIIDIAGRRPFQDLDPESKVRQ
jgi:hypothetical protein